MFIPNNAEICVALAFRTMIFTGVKDVKKKKRNSSELIIFRVYNYLVFSILQQSTSIILLKATLTYSAVWSSLIISFLHKIH